MWRRCCYLKNEIGHDQASIDAWYHHWIVEAFDAFEAMMRIGALRFGSSVTLADVCLVPQVYNARRMNVPLDRFPKIVAVDAACAMLACLRKGAAGESAGRGVTHRNKSSWRPDSTSAARRPVDDRSIAVVLRDWPSRFVSWPGR